MPSEHLKTRIFHKNSDLTKLGTSTSHIYKPVLGLILLLLSLKSFLFEIYDKISTFFYQYFHYHLVKIFVNDFMVYSMILLI